MTAGQHSAAPSALGYWYQTTWALLDLLRRGRDRPDASLSLELHDDVAWDSEGTATELLSLKHHRKGTGGLTDKHDDIWRTIRVWMDEASPTDPKGPVLTLVTTSTAAPGTAAALLRDDADRDEALALERLVSAAEGSEANATADVRARFLTLGHADQQVFISRIRIADAATHIDDVDAAIRRELWTTLPSGHEETFIALLKKWWDAIALDMLSGRRASIDVAEARRSISDLRDQFAADHLPTLVELADVDEDVVVAAHASSCFVEQMRLVNYVSGNLRRAIVDYHRAVTQTTNWLDQDLVGLAELAKFEGNLRDEWARAFDDMLDDLGEEAGEELKAEAGKQLLRALLGSTAVNVRPRYNDPFFARGKRHELADAGAVGWHPDFAERLAKMFPVIS